MGYWATSLGLCEGSDGSGQVICFTGDGSLQMNIQEFATIRRYDLPIKIFLLTNDGYQFVRMSQGGYNIDPPFGTDASAGVPIPDIGRVTKAYGIRYLSCDRAEDLDGVIDEALSAKEPVVCEVFVTKDLNVEPRIMSIANPDGSFSMPTYENLFPYLDEEVLKEEMEKAFKTDPESEE